MANKSLSQLTAITDQQDADLIHVVRNGIDYKQTRQNFQGLLISDLIAVTSSNYALNSAPLEVVAAPGALKVLMPVAMITFHDYGGTNFAFGGSTIRLIYSTATGTTLITTQTTTYASGADLTKIQLPSDNTTLVQNDSLQLYTTADGTTGNGTLYFRVIYSIMDLNP